MYGTRLGILAIGALLSLGIVLRIANLGNVSSRSPDELVYTLQAKHLLQGRKAAVRSLIAEYQRDPVVRRFPAPTRLGYLFPLATAMGLSGETDERVGRYLSCVVSAWSLLLVALIGVRFFPFWATSFALLFFAVSPMELAVARRAWTDALVEFLGLLLVYVAAEITRDSARRIWYLLFVVVGSLGIAVKETGLIGYGICAIWVLWVLLIERREWVNGTILIAGGFIALAIIVALLSFAAGGFPILANIVISIPSSNASNQYAIEYQSGPGYLLLRAAALMTPLAAVLCLTGSGVLLFSHDKVKFLHLPANAANWKVARWITFFTWVYLAWPMLLPHCLNLRYISVLFGLSYLIAGLGFWYCASLCWNRLNSFHRKFFAGLVGAALLMGAIADYARFQRIFVRDDLQDLSVKMVLDPKNPTNAIHTVPFPSHVTEAEPQDAEAHKTSGDALLRKGRFGEAINEYETALEIAPNLVSALNNFAWLLSTCPDASLRNGAKALEMAQRADQLAAGKNPTFLRTLAAAYAENGRFNDAVEAAQRASQLATAQGNFALAKKLNKDLDFYRNNFPLHPRSLTNARP